MSGFELFTTLLLPSVGWSVVNSCFPLGFSGSLSHGLLYSFLVDSVGELFVIRWVALILVSLRYSFHRLTTVMCLGKKCARHECHA